MQRNTKLLISIITLGFVLRIYRLGQHSLWHDELMTFARLQGTLHDTLTTLYSSPFPPLYYILMKAWTSIAGFSEVALRFPSALFSTLCLLYIYLITKKITRQETTALIATFLLALFPFAINYAQDAKMYPLVWFLALASWYHFLLFQEKPSTKHTLIYALTLILLCYTLYLGFLILLTQFICLIFAPRIPWKKVGIISLLFTIAYLPWATIAFTNITHATGVEWIVETTNYFDKLSELFTIIVLHYHPFVKALWLITGGIGCIFLYTYNKKNNQAAGTTSTLFAHLCIPLLAIIAIDAFYTPLLVSRYIGFLHLPLLIAVAITFNATKAKNKYLPLLLTSVCALLLITTTLIPYYQNEQGINREDWRTFGRELCHNLPENTLIFNGVNSPEAVIRYYAPCLPEKILLEDTTNEESISTYTYNYTSPTITYITRLAPKVNMQQLAFTKEIADYYTLKYTNTDKRLKAYHFIKK